MDNFILFLIAWILLFGLVIYTKSKLECKSYYPLLILKISFGLFSGWLYQVYYHAGDVLMVHRDAVFVANITDTSYQDYFLFLLNKGDKVESILTYLFYEGEPRTLFFVKLMSVINVGNLNNFWLSSVFISVLGFCATIYGIEGISKFYNIRKQSLIIAFLVVPSIGIWTSGIMKEAIVIPALVLAISFFMVKPNLIKYVLSFVLLYISFILKYYFVVPLLVVIMFSIIFKKTGFNLWLIVGAVMVSVFSLLLHPNLNFYNFYEAVLASNQLTLASSYPVNSIYFVSLESSWYSLVLYLPKAWYYGFFSPLPWQAYSDLSYLQSIQSMMILALVLWASYRLIKFKFKVGIQTILFVGYVLFMAGLLPLCSPNIGSLSRYSVIYLPVVITLCVQLYYEQKNNISS